MFGGMDTIGDQIIEISTGDADATHIRSTDYLFDYANESDKVIFVAVDEVGSDRTRIAECQFDIGLSSENELRGFIMCGSFQFKEYTDYMYSDFSCVSEQSNISQSDFPVFAIHSLGVRDEYKDSGVIEDLLSAAVESEYAHKPYMAAVWEHNTLLQNSSLFESPIAEVDDYYVQWGCPVCDEACSCSAKFYFTQ